MNEQSTYHEGVAIRPAVDLFIVNEENTSVLLGLRNSLSGKNTWSFIGGHQKSGERIHQTIMREIQEELGGRVIIEVLNEIVGFRENSILPHFNQHNTLIIKGIYRGGEIDLNTKENREINWFEFEHLPENLFSGVGEIVNSYIAGTPVVISDWHQ